MTKHDYSEEETLWMRSKLSKLEFLSSLSKLEPNSRHNVSDEPKKGRDVWVPMSQRGAYELGHV